MVAGGICAATVIHDHYMLEWYDHMAIRVAEDYVIWFDSEFVEYEDTYRTGYTEPFDEEGMEIDFSSDQDFGDRWLDSLSVDEDDFLEEEKALEDGKIEGDDDDDWGDVDF